MKIKQVIAAASAFAMIFSSAVYSPLAVSEMYLNTYAAETVDTGGDEKGVKWSLDSDGTLTISGSGSMTDTTYDDYSDLITKIVIEKGVTSIRQVTFSYLENVKSV